jgi:organic radical activating enzyme
MFGKNIIISQSLDTYGDLNVIGIFYTIQGEGPYAGLPAVFVRLAGCNLRCTWCDTDFESNPKEMTALEVHEEVMKQSRGRAQVCVITGGEPMLQNIIPLIRELNRYQLRVQIETAGTVWIPGLENVDFSLVCSPKTGRVHAKIQENCTHFKYVVGVGDVIDNGYIVTATQPKAKPARLAWPDNRATIWIQPRDDHDEEKNAANIIFARDLCLEYSYRMGVQLHKIINVE